MDDAGRRLDAVSGGPVWLTSGEHLFWDTPRQALVVAVSAGPGPQYARLQVPADQPDGPMDLLVTRRDGAPWSPPPADGDVRVALWTVTAPEQVWTPEGVRPPAPHPAAWCTVTGSQARAQAVADSVSRTGW